MACGPSGASGLPAQSPVGMAQPPGNEPVTVPHLKMGEWTAPGPLGKEEIAMTWIAQV